ncbi:YchJ family protein [Methylotenera sp. 1P/1]|uniref:YchJ family protein n=1 Tax=Methylotenera sp. 1P/1 TaxID=1131551 RepID=UPI000368F13C|nr:YchJ family metal-binding protein [Methylotenera sp. 1P/1]
MKSTKALIDCPCGSAKAYASCCQPLHHGQAAKSAEALMRSRYAAYVLHLENYLLATWHSSTRPDSLDLAHDDIKWLGLEVLREEVTSPSTAIVEFIARYKVGGTRAERMHEVSEFVYTNAWYYVTGQTN